MEEKKSLIDYMGQVFTTFGITVCIMLLFTIVFGKDAQEISSMFRLGEEGISVATLLQFFAISVIVVLIRFLVFSNLLFKKMSELLRTIIMLTCIVAVIVMFVFTFEWFPANMWEPWAMFALSFGICFVISFCIMLIQTKIENKKMEEGLARIRKEWERENES